MQKPKPTKKQQTICRKNCNENFSFICKSNPHHAVPQKYCPFVLEHCVTEPAPIAYRYIADYNSMTYTRRIEVHTIETYEIEDKIENYLKSLTIV